MRERERERERESHTSVATHHPCLSNSAHIDLYMLHQQLTYILMHKHKNLRVLKYVGEKKLEWGKYWIEQGFKGEHAYSFLIIVKKI